MYTENLSDLKAGDQVVIVSGTYDYNYQLVQIEKVTPSGLIKVRGDYYTPDGHVRGGSFRDGRLRRLTDEIRAKMEHKEIATRVDMAIHKTRIKELTIEQLRAIAAALGLE